MKNKGKHFVLIHGAAHGAWCWYKVDASLRESAAGHRVTALDMAACGINSVPVEAVSTYNDYFRPLLDFMEALPAGEKVVLVGHSMGGIGISVAMERFPEKILVAVFVTAIMPGPNLDYLTIVQEFRRELGKNEGRMDNSYPYNNRAENPPTDQVYNLSPIEDLSLVKLLARPVPMIGDELESDSMMCTEEKYGSINRVFVIGDHELHYKQDFVKWMIEKNHVHQFITISSADHMIMFSNPLELCSWLEEIAHNNGQDI